MKILIVDDDSLDRKLLRRSLGVSEGSFHKITEVSSVTDGLEAINHQRFDVILLDYRMPEIDGIEMVIEMRSKPKLGGTAIVMISSAEDPKLALDCIEAGAQDFISKSDITQSKLDKAILHAKKRFEMEQKMHESYLTVKQMAEKDALTGLSNRYHFEETLKVTIDNGKRLESSVALLALDLDDFKNVNDTLGHEAGDEVLKEVVKRVSKCLRSNEGFARIGGDEFAIILSGIESINVVNVIAKRISDTFEESFVLNGKEVHCGVSIGAALSPLDACGAQELLKCADIAMYRAKQAGKSKVCFYEARYQEEFNRRFSIQNDIANILKHSSFKLFFQPVCSTSNRDIISFEALIRWPNNDNNYPPSEFIPIAEESGVINELGRWIIKTAIEQLREWKRLKPELTISINISPVQLLHADLADYLDKVCELASIPSHDVILEITETALFKDNDKISIMLQQLSLRGFKIALDDFGMGYSSVSHLVNYPINIVKLDKSLQSTEPNDGKRKEIFAALSLMLKRLNFTVIAEGVETEAQLKICEELDVDRVQGYLLGKPSAPEYIDSLLKSDVLDCMDAG